MQPGIPLLHIHGRQKQGARLDTTAKFSAAKHSCLFATDVAARGLDFPAVDFVIQVDCPDDVDTYIHRVGRTARYNREGRGVLFLAPSEEEGMLSLLEQKKVPIEMINVRQKKRQSIKEQVQNMCFQDPALKYLGQKAFVTHVKSIYLQKNKKVFNLKEYDLEAYAASLGLPGTPRIKFLQADEDKQKKQASRQMPEISDSDSEEDAKKSKAVRTKYDRMFERQNQDVLADHYKKLVRDDNKDAATDDFSGAAVQAADADDDFMAVKRRIPADDSDEEIDSTDPTAIAPGGRIVQIAGASQPIVVDSNRREKLLSSKKKLTALKDKGKRVVYDDEGNPHEVYELEDEAAYRAKGLPEEQRQKFIEEARKIVESADVEDKRLAKEKRKEKLRKRKERERNENTAQDNDDEDEDDGAQLGDPGEDLLANFRADAEFTDDEQDGDSDEGGVQLDSEPEEQPKKKAKKEKKWFMSDSEDETEGRGSKKKKKKTKHVVEEPETLEDMEALAAGLLG